MGTVTLRGFQPEAAAAGLAALRAPDCRGLLVLATGTGKTNIAGHVMGERIAELRAAGDRRAALWLVERIALVAQAQESLQRQLPHLKIGREQGTHRALLSDLGGDDIVVASLHTAGRRRRLQGLLGLVTRSDLSDEQLRAELAKRVAFGVVDEAHCGIGNRFYRWLYSILGPTPRLGLTATPYSADGSEGMGDDWESEIYQHSLADAIEAGDLVPVQAFSVPLEGVSLQGIDFNRDTLSKDDAAKVAAAFKDEHALHQVAAVCVEKVARPALVFCASTEHAASLASILRERYGVAAEDTNCYHTDLVADADGNRVERRDDTLARFKRGELDFLCNFSLLHTGVDAPRTRSVVFVHPQGRRRYVQAIGRVTRWCCASAWRWGPCTCGARKTEGYVWDFYCPDKANDHAGITGLVYAFAPQCADPAELKALDEVLRKEDDGKKKVVEAAQVVKAAAEARAKAKEVRAQIEARTLQEMGPLPELQRRLDLCGLVVPPDDGGARATPVQREAVASLLFYSKETKLRAGPWTSQISARQAEAVMRELKGREARGLASPLQLQTLRNARQQEQRPGGVVVNVPLYTPHFLRGLKRADATRLCQAYLTSVGAGGGKGRR